MIIGGRSIHSSASSAAVGHFFSSKSSALRSLPAPLPSISFSTNALKRRNPLLRPAFSSIAAAAAAHRPPPHFADLPLDRAAHLRKQPEALEQLKSHPNSKVIAFFDRKLLVVKRAPHIGIASVEPFPVTFARDPETAEAPDGGPPEWSLAAWHPKNPILLDSMDGDLGFLFLGLESDKTTAVFACQLNKLPESTSQPLELVDVRSQGQKMPGEDAAIAGLASGLLQWHNSTEFCCRTGAALKPDSAGHARTPMEDSTAGRKSKRPRAVYPRIDPAVIVGVTYAEDWLLLGRKKTWDAGRYSLLAGFCEVAETLEQSVVREVFEESGVRIDPETIRYHSSQPWPFPQSLMIGFMGTAMAGDGKKGLEALPKMAKLAAIDVRLTAQEAEYHALPAVEIDENELEDARWFHRDWLNDASGKTEPESDNDGEKSPDSFRIPGKYALANRIITDWLLNRTENDLQWSGNAIPSVSIDTGVFKYVLLRVSDPQSGQSKLVVRGHCAAPYHNNLVTACKREAAAIDAGLQVEVLGGGRMEHYSETGVVSVYGYSAAFGPAPHEVSAAVLRKWNPFLEIDVSYEGY